ncbi:flagellar type III secretion system protein FlhB [Lutimaribacter sp. EGI FJ00015]|uniref:Flagellar type III secretion system protein FlhB n=1 Tax=Lutimaribacter degradans TaxID=2945989 RepID=A0ACC5ZU83_9RHOB|nr:flagellar type III secretion system protein FlhB [Lutimaribacter sp. EGI FJ00013]MCM2561904.1 flagellar type III secretion system protein FlhB [Lutimaribacter sp. EGI FJ00013]MCO0613064.1 flagellar type III secretion system protein FlhB [Lutimaribacter sp. EGI FJ00015]MCO0635736.1 flagellar type III secretion system protein FlhB [Lutimaribacter sp. EGI FJ00014]
MNGASGEDSDKTHEPTPRKLEEARKKGEVARSQDLSVSAAYGGLLLALLLTGASSVEALGMLFRSLIEHADGWREVFFNGSASRPAKGLIVQSMAAIAPWFVTPAALVLLTVIAQRAFIVTPSKLVPKLNRISLIANAKNKFGRGGLFEFAKSFAKLVIYSIVLFVFLNARLEEMSASVQTSPGIAMTMLGRLCIEFLFVALVVALVLGGIDYLWQWHEHMRKNRMSHKEMRDEHKDTEGDPQMKQTRRHKAQEIASRRMMQDVPRADVIIVNPTHYAVALKWSRAPGSAPECVAKGVDEIARRIREIGFENGVPVQSDPPTARALYASVEIGEEIAPEHYRAVAAAIRFADGLRQKVRRR